MLGGIAPASVRGTGSGSSTEGGSRLSRPFRPRSGKHFANGRARTGGQQRKSRRAGPNWAHKLPSRRDKPGTDTSDTTTEPGTSRPLTERGFEYLREQPRVAQVRAPILIGCSSFSVGARRPTLPNGSEDGSGILHAKVGAMLSTSGREGRDNPRRGFSSSRARPLHEIPRP